jgi:hypothetical protein
MRGSLSLPCSVLLVGAVGQYAGKLSASATNMTAPPQAAVLDPLTWPSVFGGGRGM